MSVEFINNSIECKDLIGQAAVQFLEESTGEIESATKRNSRVKTGQTRGSYEHAVDESELVGYVGSNLENAIWEEFGTGEYAVNGDGRKGGWMYVDEEGKSHYTHGKKPNQPLMKAFTSLQSVIQKMAEEIMKGLE